MTAESLKPFITLPSAENCSSHKRSPHNLIAIGLSASFVILSIVLLGFTIWNTIRVGELQKEVTTLNKVIGHMQKRLGFDYLEEYENEYGDNVLVDDPNPYSQDNDDDDEDDGDGDDDDDDGDSDEAEDIKGIPAILDYEDDDILDGSGLYDDENDDDDNMDDSSYDSSFDGFVETDDDVDPKKERKTRSISSSSNGIPIYADSYALKRNRTGGPEDERIEHHLLVNKSPKPTLRTRSPSSTESSVPERRGRYQSAPSNMLRSLNPPRHRLHRRYRNQQLLRPLLKSGKHQAIRAISMPQLTAVHYHLNNTLSGKHNLHPDHNKLPHDGDVYIGSPHPWARTLGMDKSFELNHGILTVKEAGLYFIYAQIFYDNHYDRNGFVVYHNIHPFLQCALFIPTNTIKTHTCYTSGVIYLESDDQLHLRDIHRDRTVMLTNAKSFFGIIKLGEI